jgi:O-antigen/teichoic acid export membrane protein
MRKIVFQNLSIAVVSKLIGFLSFIYIAKTISENEYGVYIYTLMVLSLLPLLQFGSMHGTIILLPKYIAKPNKSEFELFTHSNIISHLIQFIALWMLFLFNINLNLLIIIIIGANFFLSLYPQNAQMYLNSKLEFQKSNIIKAFDQLLKPILVLIIFYFYNNLESIFIAQLLATTCTLFLSIFIVPFEFLRIDIKRFKESTLKIYKIGFFIYLVWAIDIFFRTSDRWFISEFYSLDDLATYGFTSALALNVWLIAMVFFQPYAQILYTQVADKNYLEVKKNIKRTNIKLFILLFIISTLSTLIYPIILDLFIKKYFETEFLFFSLVISAVLLSINNMYIYYLVSNDFHFTLLKYQSIILVINLSLNSIVAYYHLDIIYFSFSTILSLLLYFLMVRSFYQRDIAKKINSYSVKY